MAQSHRPLEVVLIDNGSGPSTEKLLRQHLQALESADISTALRCLHRNTGFAHAMNVALGMVSAPLCLLLNPDTVLDPAAVTELAEAALAHPDCLGFAPKVKLRAYPTIIDSVGIEFAWSGDAQQRGLGQIDLGQYDEPEPVPGITMGASLIRRAAFDAAEVGLLDPRFFMFFEDVDWSLRAAIMGREFRSVPSALVYHVGSASAQTRAFRWRYALIERNVYYAAIKNFEGRHLLGVLVRRSLAHMGKVSHGKYPITTMRVLLEVVVGLGRLWPSRRSVQRTRRRPDRKVCSSVSLGASMDLKTWRPIYSWHNVRDSVRRLAVVSGDPGWARVWVYLDALTRSHAQVPADRVLRTIEGQVDAVPPALREYIGQVDSDEK
jgi:GT2 family glycosyltransferase